MTGLAIEAEQEIAGTLLRWVRVGAHMHPDCACPDVGEVDVLLVSTPEAGGYWLPHAVAWPGQSRADLLGEIDLGTVFTRATSRCSAALGVEWEALSVLVIRGLFALLAALEPPTLAVLAGLKPERLVELRRTCPLPADVVRALRLMREAQGSTQ